MLQRIGRYEIRERIGRGGQGVVSRAQDTTLDRVVAVKVINQPVTDDPQYLSITTNSSHCLVDYHPFDATTRSVCKEKAMELA